MVSDELFFESDAALAAYIGMSVPAFLKLRNSGRFPVSPRPRDDTPVVFRSDVERWLGQGRPIYLKELRL